MKKKDVANKNTDFTGISYKINDKQPQVVYRRNIEGINYFSCQMEKKKQNGEKIKYYRPLRFAKCEPPKNDKTLMMIKKGFEDFIPNKLDPYNPISVIVVMDWEEFGKNPKREVNKAYNEFTDNVKDLGDLDLPF